MTRQGWHLAWRWYRRGLQAVTVAMLVAVTGITFGNVVRRALGYGTLPWADETARRMLVWMTFVGSAIAVANHSHIVIDSLVERLGPRARQVARALLFVAAVGFFGYLLVGGFGYAMDTRTQITAAMSISRAWTNLAVPVGAALMIVSLVGAVWGPGRPGLRGEGPPGAAPHGAEATERGA